VTRPPRSGDFAEPAGRAREGRAPRDAAVHLLAAVLDRKEPLDAALENEIAVRDLAPRDRALARAIVGMALRRRGTIDAILDRLVERPPRKAGALRRVLQVAAAQLLFMGVADHAAVSLALDQLDADRDARHFKPLANAVLRRIARERAALLATAETAASDTPPWLWTRWVSAYGADIAAAIAAAHRLEPSLDVSVRADPTTWAERLGGSVLPTGSVRTIAAGDVTALPGYDEGAWWVQDAAAALPARLIGDVSGLAVADLCAAPGGKTAELAAAGAKVTAVEISARRAGRLRENLTRLRLDAEIVIADALAWQPRQPLDAVLLDAPCTATGTIRRHPDVAWLKKPEDIVTLAALQSRLLARAASFLKPGGRLVYCTCSLEAEEGEAHLAPALAGLPLALDPVSPAEIGSIAGLVRPDGTVRTLPCHLADPNPRLGGLDGFFIMRLRRTA
jgi:16S rRNA (cytosine967-C5)-methyltransferase